MLVHQALSLAAKHFPLLESKECFKEAETVKMGTNFIWKDSTMNVRVHRESLFIQVRSLVEIHTQAYGRKHMGILSGEESSKEVIFKSLS